MTNFRLFHTEEFADDSFEFDKSGGKFSKRVENTEKIRNCSLQAIFSFPTVFSKYGQWILGANDPRVDQHSSFERILFIGFRYLNLKI